MKSTPETKTVGCVIPVLVIFAIAYAIFKFTDTSVENSTTSVRTVVDEDALADENCKTSQGFSHIFACRRAVGSAAYDPDVFEKWDPYGARIKGYGFCEGFTRKKGSIQFKIHYNKDCTAKELWIWDYSLDGFKQVKFFW